MSFGAFRPFGLFAPFSANPIAAGIAGLFTPAHLFDNNEQGVWYDPSDFSTMFQDSTGTTPVTAVGQPVGLILDKRLGSVRGPELVTNGTFDTNLSGWNASGVFTVSGGVVVSTATTNQTFIQNNASIPQNSYCEISFTILTRTYGRLRFRFLNSGSQVSATPFHDAPGTYRYILPTSSANQYQIDPEFGVGFGGTFDNISVKELPGNHASQATAASRPVLQRLAGGQYYLLFDGVDDWLQTAAINFTATDKVNVFAGVRKLSDAATAVVCELSVTSATSAGSFAIFAPDSPAVANYMFRSFGSILRNAVISGIASPNTSVITGIGDISGDVCTARRNGAVDATNTNDGGTGNYGNYPLYIGRRAGTTLPFNGHLYQLVIRGALSTDDRIRQTEEFIGDKTGVEV